MRVDVCAICIFFVCSFATDAPPAPAQSRHTSVVTIAVSPSGDDAGEGTVEHPFRTLERAQRAVREMNNDHDVVVRLAHGVYRIDHPIIFHAADGGRNGHTVTWSMAARGAQPVVSGGLAVGGWCLWNA